MPLPTCEVVCVMHDQEGAPVPGATFDAVLNQFEVYQGYVVPQRVIGTADEQGVCVLNLWPNQLGSVESAYVVRMRSPSGKSLTITAVVPDQPTANLHDVAVLPPYPGKIDGQVQVEAAIEAGQQAQVSAQAAEASATAAAQSESNAAASEAAAASSEALAQEWATKTDAEVVVGEGYGAKKYASEAASSATAAANSAAAAATFNPGNYVPLAGGVAMTGHIAVPSNASGNQVPRASEVVHKTGDTMTGPLEVPAGATGNQVPRASEVVHMTGAETIAGVKTFSSKPKVPAGATGAEVPQAQEIFGKGQSWQTVTRTSGMTYTNSTGKPFLFTIIGVATADPAILYVEIGGSYSYRDVGWIVGDAVVITAVIPDGLTYKYVATDIGSITTREYR